MATCFIRWRTGTLNALFGYKNYQLNSALLAKAGERAIVLHCLPAHRGEEITEEVLEGPQSVVFDQAENKMHIHAAILEHFIAGAGAKEQ